MTCFFTMQLNWLSLLQVEPQIFSGEVIQKKSASKNSIQVLLQIHTLDEQSLWPKPRAIIYWQDGVQENQVEVGDRVSFQGHLSPIHGFLNQGGFVSERWFLGQGVTATGENAVLRDHQAQHTRNLRSNWINAFSQALAPLSQKGIFTALIFGERDLIEFRTRQVFQQAGIAHLLVISGLHIGLLAAWVFWLLRPWCSYIVTAVLVFSVAGSYAALAGFSPPTQRALYVVALLLGSQLSGTSWPKSILMMVCFIGIIVFDPWAVFSMSFWLSFSAVLVLVLCHTLWRTRNVFLFQTQLGLFMIPLQAFFFSGLSPLSVAMNLLAVPLFCFLIVPATLIFAVILMIVPELAFLGFSGLNAILDYGLRGLFWSQKHLPLWFDVSRDMQFLIGLLGILSCALYFNLRPVFIYTTLSLGMLAYVQPKPNWQIDAFDVGNFMAVLVRTPSAVILYEDLLGTPSGRRRFQRVVVPTLRSMGIQEISLLVHQAQHWGEQTPHLKGIFPVQHLWVNQRSDYRGELCRHGQKFEADNLSFNVLWPHASMLGKSTEYCALHITDGNYNVLLSAIPSDSQQRLIKNWPDEIRHMDIWIKPPTELNNIPIKSDWNIESSSWNLAQNAHVSTGQYGQIAFNIGYQIQVKMQREQGPWYVRLDQ